MPISPLYVGETHRPLSVTWIDDSGAALNLSGATLTVRWDGRAGSASFAGSGTFNVTNAAGGLFTYTFSATDLATAGAWDLQFKATYGDGTPTFSDPVPISVLATL